MKQMTLEEIAAACHGRLVKVSENDEKKAVTDISIDSRNIKEGFLYIPIKGQRFDGHDFIESTAEAGAVCTLTETEKDGLSIPQIVVSSTSAALRDIAEYYRSIFKNVKVIGISGSSGKTSTKEMIYSVLSEHFRVMKTEGNLNNEIGVPKTLFRLNDEYEAAVVEMGINHFGEMTNLAKMVRPDIAVITNIGCAHLEFLGSRDGILKAKTEMLPFISENGIAVLNGDDDKLCTVDSVETRFFGMNENNSVKISDIKTCGIEGTEFTLTDGENCIKAFVPALGNHMVMNAAAAYTIAHRLGMTNEEIIRGIRNFKNIDGRFNVIKTEKYTLINDCYNANPESVKASLGVLGKLEGRRVAVLADMKELGENEEKMHISTGELAADMVDVLICIGPLAKFIKEGADKTGKGILTYHFDKNDDALAKISSVLKENDTVLIKGSHSMNLSEITEYLKK